MAKSSTSRGSPSLKAEPGVQPGVSPRVVVCVGSETESQTVIPSAKAISKALGASLAFLHVIETGTPAGTAPPDPVEWELRRREAHAYVADIARQHSEGEGTIATQVLEGRSAECICGALCDRPQDIVAVYRGSGRTIGHVGETVRQVLEHGVNSLLVFPDTPVPAGEGFDRIIVPLDGSSQSETAIPVAVRIAESQDAELILVQALPEIDLLQDGPPEPDDMELVTRLRQRNARVARKYLNRVSGRVRAGGLRVRTLVLRDGDVRRALATAVDQQSADLMVMASHGRSAFADVALGDVATYLLSRLHVPVLMIRCAGGDAGEHVFAEARAKGTRMPGANSQ